MCLKYNSKSKAMVVYQMQTIKRFVVCNKQIHRRSLGSVGFTLSSLDAYGNYY